MPVTYDPTTALGQLRRRIADTAEGGGPRPGTGTATNYSDAELAAIGYGLSGAAEIFTTLAAEWARYADQQAGPLRKSLSQVADRYLALAAQYRAQAAAAGVAGAAASTTFAAGLGRRDGYAARADGTDAP